MRKNQIFGLISILFIMFLFLPKLQAGVANRTPKKTCQQCTEVVLNWKKEKFQHARKRTSKKAKVEVGEIFFWGTLIILGLGVITAFILGLIFGITWLWIIAGVLLGLGIAYLIFLLIFIAILQGYRG